MRHTVPHIFPAVLLAAFAAGLCLAPGCVPEGRRKEPQALIDGFRYRHLKLYTTSVPDSSDPAHIVATLRLLNEGPLPFHIRAELQPKPAAGFPGSRFDAGLRPGSEAQWTFDFHPPEGLKREIFTGKLAILGVEERDLFVALQGPDPVDFPSGNVERITARGQVVATYAPRTRGSIDRLVLQKMARRGRPEITLAAAGKSKYSIVVDALPIPSSGNALESWKTDKSFNPSQMDLVQAIEDLQRCIRIQSSATLPVLAQAQPEGPAIWLRLNPSTSRSIPPHDGYFLGNVRSHCVIEARTLEGLRQGIFGLLTDHMDCHWFLPSQLGEEIVIPKNSAIRLPRLNETRGASWFSVTGMSFGAAPLWDRRTRSLVNRGRMNFGHSWVNYIHPGEFPYDKFPDMFARDREGKIRKMDRGWTSTNFCSTNPEVIENVARKVNAQLSANPGQIVASIDPNDYGLMCLCDRCLALDKSYEVTRLDGTEVADRLLHFSNEIHRRLDEKNKDKFLGILIYGYQMELPVRAQAHDHHVGTICNFPPRYDHSRPWNDPTSGKNRDFFRLVKGWGARLKQLGYYDYYGHYYYFGPYGIIHKMREDLPAFRDLGGTFLVIEAESNFSMHGINLYVCARLAWDVDADVDLLLEEFFRKFYGPAADPMRQFWLASERHFALERPGDRTELSVAARPEFWSELDTCLKQAEDLVRDLPPTGQRFKDRVTFHRDGFDFGRRHYDLGLSGRIWKLARSDPEAALKTGQEFLSWVQNLRKKYPDTDFYWPTMLRPYFYSYLDGWLTRLARPKDPD